MIFATEPSGPSGSTIADQPGFALLADRPVLGGVRQAGDARSAPVTTKAAADTAGEFIEIEGTMRAHSGGPPIHVHPHQEETYRVVSGTADVFLDGRWHRVRAGESLTVPKGAPHTIKNEHDEDVTAMNWHRPAARFEEFSRTFHRLATSGRIKSLPPKDPSSVVYTAMLFTEYEDTLANPYVAAERGYIDAVIAPHETRVEIVRSLCTRASSEANSARWASSTSRTIAIERSTPRRSRGRRSPASARTI